MIPDYLLHAKSSAERRVFDRLREALNGEGWFALHSLNLPQHSFKRFGEIDFVVCGPGGLFALEVKGGRISCQNGEWGTTDESNHYTPLKEAPHTQAEGALHGLLNKLDASLSSNFVCGYGVITPDCSMAGINSAEWDKSVWADITDMRDFSKWFVRFVGHWKSVAERQRSTAAASRDKVEALVAHLRPDFCTATPLFDKVALVEERIALLTKSQLRLVDVFEENPRAICSGGAGTGKTFLAVELAKRWAALGAKTALTCCSPWLMRYIDSFCIPNVTVAHIDALEAAARRAGIQRFDMLIVDEGQDLLNISSLSRMDALLAGGLENGRWCFFHDSNNQAGALGSFEGSALKRLQDLRPVNVPLRINCRNTAQILDEIKSALGADMGSNSVGNGPDVVEIHCGKGECLGDGESTSDVLKRELVALMRDGDFTAGDIVVLSPHRFRASGAYGLRSSKRIPISEMDSFSPGDARSSIGFATISDFKGLESEVVFVIDMPAPGSEPSIRNLQYIAMSRARALLYLLIDDSQ